MTNRAISAAAAVLIAGCMFLPAPTDGPVREADLVGTWQYEANPRENRGVPENDGVVTLELMAGGTFEQTVVPAGGGAKLIQKGTWMLDGSGIGCENILLCDPATSKWTISNASWYVIDGRSLDRDYVIFGGDHPDPDSFHEFRRVP